MIQMYTYVDVADNTGAKECMCIKVLGGTKRRYAHVGDVIMSLIQTCRLNGTDPFDYLTAIQRFKDHVKAAAYDWLPWNYVETRAKLLNAMKPAGT